MAGKDIEVLKGKTNPNILLIAPHGHPKDDVNTGALVRSIQKILDCPAIINEAFRKPKEIEKKPGELESPNVDKRILDLYQKDQAEKYPKFLKAIGKKIKQPDSTFVFWIHGIDDKNIKTESEAQSQKDTLHCLIGHGQPDRDTCNKATAMGLFGALNTVGIKACTTSEKAKDYRGWDTDRLNQYFRVSGNGFKGVQSVQLEFGFKGVRDKDSIEKTAEKFSRALVSLSGTVKINPIEDQVDEKLVSESLDHLSGLFNGGYHQAMRQAGDYIIEKFFGGDPQRAIDNRPVLKNSVHGLIKKLKEGSEKAPSKSWFYNAQKLAAYEQVFEKEGFQIFGNLGHSHKQVLLHVKDIGKLKNLAAEAVEKKCNVEQLRQRIRESKETKSITLKGLEKQKDLKGASRKKLESLEKQAKERIERYQSELKSCEESLDLITRAIKALPAESKKTKKAAKSGKVVNIENGRKKRESKADVESKAEPKAAKGA
jgi:hypothetical protein